MKSIRTLIMAFVDDEVREDAEVFHREELWLRLLQDERDANFDLFQECGLGSVSGIQDPWHFPDWSVERRARARRRVEAGDGVDLGYEEFETIFSRCGVIGGNDIDLDWEEIQRRRVYDGTHLIHQTLAAWMNNKRFPVYDPGSLEAVEP
jgi:hypothetical protein